MRAHKPQQLTLTVRIPEELHRRIESYQALLGPEVSLSDAARALLESAQVEDIETADLLSKPKESLLSARTWIQHGRLSAAQWRLVMFYVDAGCQPGAHGTVPGPRSFEAVLCALLAVRDVRVQPCSELDRFYSVKVLGRLATDEALTRTIRRLIQQLASGEAVWPRYAGRALREAVAREQIPFEAMNTVLSRHGRFFCDWRHAGTGCARAARCWIKTSSGGVPRKRESL